MLLETRGEVFTSKIPEIKITMCIFSDEKLRLRTQFFQTCLHKIEQRNATVVVVNQCLKVECRFGLCNFFIMFRFQTVCSFHWS